jgi:hypothetical protein
MNNTEAARIITSATRVKTLEAISGLIVIASVRGKGHQWAAHELLYTEALVLIDELKAQVKSLESGAWRKMKRNEV